MTNEFPVPLPGTVADTLMWAHPHEVEPQALNQLRNISKLPWVEKVRVMPDVHLGTGAAVGSVIAMRNAVSPSAVGVDIGCGVIAVRTSLRADHLPDDLSALRRAVETAVPVGFTSHGGYDHFGLIDQRLRLEADSLLTKFSSLRARSVEDRAVRAAQQCGTLGGGNHFIELCADGDGDVWITLHSGSRNIGKELAEWHINEAKGLDHNLDLPDRDLAVFLSGSQQMEDYLHDLHWAQDYAAINRRVMLDLVKRVVSDAFAGRVSFGTQINAHHNYVSHETYDGVDLIVTRKGAIRASSGWMAMIPGSMGTGSYIVRGLGSDESLQSASHGAGRKMSRSKAKKNFTVEDLREQTAGIECRKDQGVVDEIPGAYKPIESVIEAQSDLVEVVARLQTLLCVKG